ncbi:unnamed protein product [Nesidiocoris tenuis]|uniref:Uncharacterized protein n=1 Tax=Nesidiocoris tenuis TaxID=355587 RepID=A0A6H5GQ57_9HEMI|nr:unnamed protein product [Nesidiocoris tenuis]CAB0005300.1 unnamed protein product [Nesidiocoris tenuis]
MNWDEILVCDRIDGKVGILNRNLECLLDKHFPVRRVRKDRPPAPWITDEIRGMMALFNNPAEHRGWGQKIVIQSLLTTLGGEFCKFCTVFDRKDQPYDIGIVLQAQFLMEDINVLTPPHQDGIQGLYRSGGRRFRGVLMSFGD